MSKPEEPFVERVHEALDASAEALPPGVASRLAAARSEALAQRAGRGGWQTFGYGALATAALLLALALTVDPDATPAAPTLAETPEPPTLDPVELDLAMDLDVIEELEFVAWLLVEDAGVDAG